MEKIVVNVSSYNRINSLLNTLTSIYDQCHEINVCLNDYNGEIPEFLLSPKINLTFTDNSPRTFKKKLLLFRTSTWIFF